MAAAFQGKCPFSGMAEEFKMRPQEPKYLRLKNWIESTQAVDTLHQKATNVSEIASHDKFLLQKKKKKKLNIHLSPKWHPFCYSFISL